MTRVLWWAAWIFGCIAAIAYILAAFTTNTWWPQVFVTTTLASAVAVLWYGFRVSPESGGGQ